MLSFFRKHQKIFFLFVTIIVVTTFVFFGTYQAFAPAFRSKEEEKAFETLDKKKVSCAYFQDITRFLGHAPLSLKGGNNFLSDAFLSKDIIESGLYLPIVAKNMNATLQNELSQKIAKEKHFKPYTNPYVPMVNVENVWAFFAPDIKEKLQNLQSASDSNVEAFKLRAELFLAERRFPAEILSYILQHQVEEYPDLPYDPRLQVNALSLFNYHTPLDWFGPTFVEAVATTVIQGAAWARELGHKVSREEVIADIAFRREKAFQQNPALKGRFGTSLAYYQECLKMLSLDEERVIQITTDLLLFRRLFESVGNIPLADMYSLQRFYESAGTYVEVELYHLPKEYILQSSEDLKKLETYYQLIASQREHPLDLPLTPDPIDVIEERAPELVVTSFEVELKDCNLKELAAKVSVKETFAWESDPQHRELLKKSFPQIKIEEIEDLSRNERSLIDAFAREEIVKKHPEWIEEGLRSKSVKSKKLVFGVQQESLPGITSPMVLKELLERGEELKNYSQDGIHFYSFTLKTKNPEKRILSYSEALAKGVLEELVEDLDENLYQHVENLVQGDVHKRWDYLLNKFRTTSSGLSFIEKREEKIYPEGGVISFEEAQKVAEGDISPICFSSELGAYYFKSLGKKIDTTVPLEKLLGEQKLIAQELKKQLLNQLLEKF